MSRAASAPSLETRLAQTGRDQAVASNPEFSVWVSANAGTGKTHVLTMRVLRLLLAGNKPEAILCLTYTKAAAAEMSKRVFDKLAEWVTMPEPALVRTLESLIERRPSLDEIARARTLFAIAIETPGGLKIQTIHAFAEKLLQRFPLEANVAPGFSILEEDEARRLTREAIDATLVAAARDTGGALGAALSTAVAYAVDDNFDAVLTKALDERDWIRAADRMGWDTVEGLVRKHLGVRAGVTRTELTDDAARVLTESDLDRLVTALSGGAKSDGDHAAMLRAARGASSANARVHLLAAYFLTGEGDPRARLMTAAIKSAHPDLDAAATRAQGRLAALWTELAAWNAVAASVALYRLASEVMQRYTEAKARRAALDFDDLIDRAGSLLRVPDTAQWVLYKLDAGLAHILVDESQDTAPAQWRIIDALAGEFFAGAGQRDSARTVFAVGDEKQSIYSFQGAEANEFARMGHHFAKAATAAGARWQGVPLTLSFRTVEPVLAAVDRVFADPARVPGVAAAAGRIEHLASRMGQAGLVEIWPLERRMKPGDTDPWLPLEEAGQPSPVARLAGRIADTIKGWLEGGERLESEGRPITAGDILILVRKRHPFAGPMTAALKARGIAVAGADRVKLTEHIAVQDFMALGDFLTLPEDDLALACVLKSPMFGLDDNDLFALAHGRKSSLWRSLLAVAPTSAKLGAAAETLKRWRKQADFMPPFELLAALLDRDGMRQRMIGRLGPDAAEAIDEFANLALGYDDHAPPSLSGFLAWLRDGRREVKRDMDHGRNEVRVMTVHGAKGLEAPVVILPDTCTTASGGRQGALVALPGVVSNAPDPFAWCVKGSSGVPAVAAARSVEEERAARERHRLLYVAMTRARDRLYIAGFEPHNGPAKGCWYELVHEALAPVAERVPQSDGRHILRIASPQTEPPGRPRHAERVEAKATEPPQWARSPARAEPQLTVPLAPSRLAPYETDEDGEPLAAAPARDPLAPPPVPALGAAGPAPEAARPRPAEASTSSDEGRFLRGTLTHALLEHLPQIGKSARPAAARAFVARRGSILSRATQESIVAETLAVLDDPAFAPLFGPGSQAEVPIVAALPRPSGTGPALKLTGQIDRLAVTSREVLIVDYKTNRPPPRHLEGVADVYLYQLAAYRLAVAEIFGGKPVRAALLWTGIPRLMEIPASVLDAYAARLWTLDPDTLGQGPP